jgi:hypothetical protein
MGHSMRTLSLASLLAATLILASACAPAVYGRAYVRVGPPAPIVEVHGVRPGAHYVWIPGYYRWGGAAYVWVNGRWTRPPRGRSAWVPGHWTHNRRGWFFVEGRWR